MLTEATLEKVTLLQDDWMKFILIYFIFEDFERETSNDLTTPPWAFSVNAVQLGWVVGRDVRSVQNEIFMRSKVSAFIINDPDTASPTKSNPSYLHFNTCVYRNFSLIFYESHSEMILSYVWKIGHLVKQNNCWHQSKSHYWLDIWYTTEDGIICGIFIELQAKSHSFLCKNFLGWAEFQLKRSFGARKSNLLSMLEMLPQKTVFQMC